MTKTIKHKCQKCGYVYELQAEFAEIGEIIICIQPKKIKNTTKIGVCCGKCLKCQ